MSILRDAFRRHPLRLIRRIVNDALASLDIEFDALYTDFGRPGRLCCTNPVRDSSRESRVAAGVHEQTDTPNLQDPELTRLQ